MRSTIMVTIAALGLTRSSRIGKTTGRTTSPALPIKKTVPKPTVVAAKRSAKRDDTNGRSNAPQRKALTAYDRLTIEAAAKRRYGLEWLAASRTSPQFNFRPNHQNRAAASMHSPQNSRYLR